MFHYQNNKQEEEKETTEINLKKIYLYIDIYKLMNN